MAKLEKRPLKTRPITVEQRVVDRINNMPMDVIIGGTKYRVKPPTLSTIFRVSAIVSAFPQSETKLSNAPEEVLKHVLLNAYQYSQAGDVIAALVLGWNKNPTEEFIAEYEALSALVEDTFEPREYDQLLQRLLNVQQTADFFALTATLSELNLIEGKREETTDNHPTD